MTAPANTAPARVLLIVEDQLLLAMTLKASSRTTVTLFWTWRPATRRR